MAADNVKKAFCLLNGINEDFTGIQHDRTVTATASKKCPPPTTKYQPEFKSEGISVTIAIRNDISKTYYQKGLVIYFLRST